MRRILNWLFASDFSHPRDRIPAHLQFANWPVFV